MRSGRVLHTQPRPGPSGRVETNRLGNAAEEQEVAPAQEIHADAPAQPETEGNPADDAAAPEDRRNVPANPPLIQRHLQGLGIDLSEEILRQIVDDLTRRVRERMVTNGTAAATTDQPPAAPATKTEEEKQAELEKFLPPAVRSTKEPRSYRPEDDASLWIKQYEIASVLNGWNDQFNLATVELYMTGTALQWAQNCLPGLTQWKAFKKAFLARFDIGRVAKAKSQLRRLIRDEEQPLLDHLENVQWLCHQVDPAMSDADIIERFSDTISGADYADLQGEAATKSLRRLRAVLEARKHQAATRNKAPQATQPRPTIAAVSSSGGSYDRLSSPSNDRGRSPRREPSQGRTPERSSERYGGVRSRNPDHRQPDGYRYRNPSQGRRQSDDHMYRAIFEGDRRSWDNKPICNYCDRVGHVQKHCRDKANRVPAARAPNRFGTNTRSPGRPQTENGYRPPHRSPSPYGDRQSDRAPSPGNGSRRGS
ncbi:uncharacterized protein LOC108864124 [Galendromus occidentalis]|uniref:Uncharacterized protein LOC108864124 n=1 Tax=Galendromus occidentalis TaxID=34638 RepID=A0AAJ7P9J7_9ACAR|nr:uncharacterized protein LOC108864124 [Galendromus occidentalis]